MADQLSAALRASMSGLTAQSLRMRIASENIANSQATGVNPGSLPYARKTIAFAAAADEAENVATVAIASIAQDKSARVEHRPGHPAADEQGMVKLPNVDPLIEIADMREAHRSYLANVQMIRQARETISATIDLLKGS